MTKPTKLKAEELDKMFNEGYLWCPQHQKYLPIERFSRTSVRSRYGYRNYCNDCIKRINRERGEYSSQYFSKRNKEIKQHYVDLMGGCCQVCGYNNSLEALDFHHVDPALKDSVVNKYLYGSNKETLLEELDKCCLICSNCHREYHGGYIELTFIKRDGLGYTTI